ncbi:DUF4230 domain-containing protein [Myxacorys almedinensis]|uniref:DUF4230 domain-containing protein n=1 Tax=Myxacorys almedinensis A TaxID=2690445 RepID=A0A8J7Z461_9CYAN|nr:DUF4230 domain-containing protein [Myxacorys almedinensis]NDJ17798.1 DUF4230 domain-containing protein [Myxacorys almedinensis A]
MRGKKGLNRDTPPVFKNLSGLLVFSLAMVGVVSLVQIGRSGSTIFDRFTSLFQQQPPAPKVDTRSVVIQQVREASELTTAIYTMEAVVPAQQDAAIAGFVVGTTKLLYIARGEIRAGVDLSALTPENVNVTGDTLRLRLPPPRLLDQKIDVAKSGVYDYNRGFLGLGPDTAPELQRLAQAEALKKIQTAACAEGVLEKANDRAKLVVSQLIRVSGVNTVVVETQAPAADACQSS